MPNDLLERRDYFSLDVWLDPIAWLKWTYEAHKYSKVDQGGVQGI